jgi:DNA polymerase-3 subunit epsilon
MASRMMMWRMSLSIRDFIEVCDIGGFNIIRFDLPFLEAKVFRAKAKFSWQMRYLVDSQIIYYERTLVTWRWLTANIAVKN